MTTNVPPRRKISRAPGVRAGVVKLGMFKQVRCAITDFSVNGAKLESKDAADLPETFHLSVRGTGKTRKYKCIKRWNKGNTIGVEFLTD